MSAALASATEFQTIGPRYLGIGGAGVARSTGAMAPYWNPAGLAFNQKTVASTVSAGVGLQLGNGLADTVDKIDAIDFNNAKALTGVQAQDQAALGEAVKLLSATDNLKGHLTVRANAVFGNQIGNFGVGLYSTFEGASRPEVDMVNIAPASAGGTKLSVADLNTATAGAAASTAFFTADEAAAINAAFTALGANGADVKNTLDAYLAANPGGVTSAEATQTLLKLAAALDPASTSAVLDTNKSILINRALALFEVPVSYGHSIDIGKYGQLGLGVSAKLMKGRVYASSIRVFDVDGSSGIVDQIKDSYTDSTTWGVDLGALWKLSTVSVGVVAKNLNSPTFDGVAGTEIKVKPQVRVGATWSPTKWLSVAADADVTSNETMVDGIKSQVIGGGLELMPTEWFQLRVGAYKNIAEDDSPVATAGLTFGTKWVNLDLDAAAATKTAKYDGKSYPEEARVQVALNFMF